MSWFASAKCRGRDTNDFFDTYDKLKKEDKEAFLKICDLCPVKIPCAQYAKETGAWGIYAGKRWKDGKPYEPLRNHMDILEGIIITEVA